MAEHLHLNNPPIKEALIDLRVALNKDVSVNQLRELHEQIQTGYPMRKTLREGRFSLQFDAEADEPPKATSDHSVLGYRYESGDGTKVAQFRLNGFTYSKVGSYSTWEDMRDEARELWSVFASATEAETVTRVATRFINVLPIPRTLEKFEDYVTAPPIIPKELPQALSQFLTRVVIPEPEMEATAIITQALETGEPDKIPIVLDVEVFVNGNFDIGADAYWERLEQLRVLKNDIFFASITEMTLELFR